MFLSQLSQYIALKNPEPNIVLTGTEQELYKALAYKKIPNECKILGMVPKFSVNDFNNIKHYVGVNVIYYDFEESKIELIYIPTYEKYHTYFGYEHKPTELLTNMEIGDILEKDNILTKTNSVGNGNVLAYGKNANVLYGSFREINEDAIVASEEILDEMKFSIYHTYKGSGGSDSIFMNLYGDENHYKIMPDIGEKIRDDGMIMAIRKFNSHSYLTDFTDNALRCPNPVLDKCYFSKYGVGTVVDINVYHYPKSQKFKKWSGFESQLEKYYKQHRKTSEQIMKIAHTSLKQYNNVIEGDHLHNKMVEELMLTDPKVTKLDKKEVLDQWYVEITVRYDITPGIGFKVTDSHGGKGIISHVLPRSEMPKDKNGLYADFIFAGNSTVGRNNGGRLYEGHLASSAKLLRKEIIDILRSYNKHLDRKEDIKINTDDFNYIKNKLIRFYKIVSPSIYEIMIKSSDKSLKDFIKDIVVNNIHIHITNEDSDCYDIINKLQATDEFRREKEKFSFGLDGVKHESEEPILMYSNYVMLLSKIADDGLVVNTPKTNHFGVPISPSQKNKTNYPWNNNPVKFLPEPETRIIATYCDPHAIAELRDIATDLDSQTIAYKNILYADKPANIDKIIDRRLKPYTGGEPVKILRSLFRSTGSDISYKKIN